MRGHLDDAWRLLGEAVTTADRAGADLPRAKGLIELGRLAARDRLRVDEATQNLLLARGAIARLGDPPRLVVDLEQTEADLAMLRGQPSAAIELLRHALAAAREAHVDGPEASLRNDLAGAYMALGRAADALHEHEQVSAILEAAHANDRDTGAGHMNIAGALCILERFDEARAHAQHAVELLRAHGDSRLFAQALGNLGYVQAAIDEMDAAIATAEESLQVTERVLGPAHVDVALRLKNLGEMQRAGGHLDAAAPPLHRAIAIYTALGDQLPALADALTELAELELDAGRPQPALDAAERAQRLRADAGGNVEATPGSAENARRAEDALTRARAALTRARHR